MQLYALDNSSLVLASEARRDFSYSCPECQGVVRLRGGKRRQSHFYHLRRPSSCLQHGKSLAHLQLQLHLKAAIPSLILEKRFVSRIADACWEAEKIVFEIQCSPLSEEEAEGRCRDYNLLGFTPVWILHDKTFNGRTLSPAEAYLRLHTPTYFTDGFKIYDQYEICQNHRRIYTSEPLPIDPTRPRKGVKLSFPGDLSHQDPERWQRLEKSHRHRARWQRVKNFYRYLFYRLLERCSF